MTGTSVTSGAADAAEDSRLRRETIKHAFAFIGGFALALSALFASVGALAAAFGSDDAYFVRDHQGTLQQIAGVVLVVMGLNLAGVIRIPFLYRTYSFDSLARSRPALAGAGAGAGGGTITIGSGHAWGGVAYAKSTGLGAAFAIGWTPCLGPVLGAIIGLSSQSDDVAQGFYLTLVYAMGLGVPFVITAFAVVPVTGFLRRYRWLLPYVEIVMGVMIIFVGALIFLDEATIFNRFFSDLPFLDRLNEI
jgi:cytochrome c-type biogenesis protein